MKFTQPLIALACALALNAAHAVAPKPSVIPDKTNWLSPEVNVWSYQNANQLFTTATVSRGASVPLALEEAPQDLDGFKFTAIVEGKEQPMTITDYLAKADADGYLVLHRGKNVYERYFNGMDKNQQHILMSVTKSFTGTLAAQLIAEGKLKEDAKVEVYLDFLQGKPAGQPTVRQVLDMTAGLQYDENYADPNADVWAYLGSVGLLPRPENFNGPTNVAAYLQTMQVKDKPGELFNYVTPMSEILQALIVAVEGKPYHQVLSERVWQKLGADSDAYVLVEEHQQALAGTGLSMTLRDMARFAQMILNKGNYNGRQIISTAAYEDIAQGGDKKKFAPYGEHNNQLGWSYRAQWWHPHNQHNAFMALGVFGQVIYIDPAAQVVVVKQASDDKPVTDFANLNDPRAALAIAKHLTGK